MPSKEEVQRHEVDHAQFAPWCKHCVAGRSRGEPHKSIRGNDDKGEFEMDYTYYSEEGYQISREMMERAQCALTCVHKSSGCVIQTVIVRKGPWPYAVQLVVNFILNKFIESLHKSFILIVLVFQL